MSGVFHMKPPFPRGIFVQDPTRTGWFHNGKDPPIEVSFPLHI